VFVYRSNRLEELVDALSSVVQQKPARVLEPELILIQSAGMERYLYRELARRLGIMAGAQFPFPRAFMRQILDRVLGKSSAVDVYERQLLSWLLFDELGSSSHGASLRAITAQLEPDVGATRRLYFAERLAHLYDQYLTYRPEMVLAWEEQPGEHWQAQLWTTVVARLGGEHFARRCHRLLTQVDDEHLRLNLPERIIVFGGPGLPPLYLQMLARMAQAVPVHVFCLNISEQYFHDFTGGRKWEGASSIADHPLLTSMGQVGGDFQFLLESLTSYQEAFNRHVRHEPMLTRRATVARASIKAPKVRSASERQLSLFGELSRDAVQQAADAVQQAIEPAQHPAWDGGQIGLTTLQLLQNSLLDGTLEPVQSASGQPFFDDSITVDNCHSRQREVETLHDRLLGWFAADPSLRPEDVVVLAPNIEDYVALIDAVFSARAGERPLLPYRIFDRSFRHQDPGARVLSLGLGLLNGRFKVGDVLDLLQLDPVRVRYEMSPSDLERVTGWLSQVNIRSGVDAEHRRSLGLPAFDENSWRFGLRRLLLGYAVPDEGTAFDDVVAHDDVAAADGLVLGKLCEFCEQLFSFRQELVDVGTAGLTLKDWSNFLSRLAVALIGESTDGSWDLAALLQSLYAMDERRQALEGILGDHPDALLLGHEAMRHLLESELASVRFSADFLAGGVSFCSLLPLRNVPFRRVCVLGLNQGQFPRTDMADPLNLMQEARRPGDRSLRADDRYLFVELLLSAREQISLSYVGRSIQDNSLIPPSVVLTELEAVVARLDGGGRGILQRVHPLQPFHPSYFSPESELQAASFDRDYFHGAEALVGQLDERSTFLRALPLAPFEEELPLLELMRSLRDPALHYLRRLGVNPEAQGQTLLEREPIKLDSLQEYVLGEHLLGEYSQHGAVDAAIELRRGQWPVGRGGSVLLSELTRGTQVMLDIARGLRSEHAQKRVLVEVTLNGTQSERCAAIFEHAPHHQAALVHYQNVRPQVLLSGTITDLYGPLRVVQTYGRNKARRRLRLLIEHLALCSVETDFQASVLLCRGDQDHPVDGLALRRLSSARATQVLSDLSCLFYLGRHAPLPYFAEWSADFVDKLRKQTGTDERDAIAHAFFSCSGEEEYRRPGFKQVFRELEPRTAAGAADLSEAQQPFVRMALFMDELMQESRIDLPLSGPAQGGDL